MPGTVVICVRDEKHAFGVKSITKEFPLNLSREQWEIDPIAIFRKVFWGAILNHEEGDGDIRIEIPRSQEEIKWKRGCGIIHMIHRHILERMSDIALDTGNPDGNAILFFSSTSGSLKKCLFLIHKQKEIDALLVSQGHPPMDELLGCPSLNINAPFGILEKASDDKNPAAFSAISAQIAAAFSEQLPRASVDLAATPQEKVTVKEAPSNSSSSSSSSSGSEQQKAPSNDPVTVAFSSTAALAAASLAKGMGTAQMAQTTSATASATTTTTATTTSTSTASVQPPPTAAPK